MAEQILRLLASRKGHFRLESGHHSDLWLDLEQLCFRPRDVRPFLAELVERLAKYKIDGVCGALNEGAFLSLLVASELGVEFSYSERFDTGRRDTLYPVEYRIPGTLRTKLSGKRVAIVNDVISAGSAVRGTFADLKACGAEPVAIGALLVLGDAFASFAAEQQVGLESIAFAPHNLWKPSECPLCASNVRLENPGDSESQLDLSGVLETALYVADLDRSAAFYQRILGFPLASEPTDRMRVLSITTDQVLLLFKKGGSVRATVTPFGTIPPTDGDGSLHVAFFIPSSDLELWQDRLRRSGVDIESLVTWPAGGRSIYFRDPDNHAIELKTSNWHGKELRGREP